MTSNNKRAIFEAVAIIIILITLGSAIKSLCKNPDRQDLDENWWLYYEGWTAGYEFAKTNHYDPKSTPRYDYSWK